MREARDRIEALRMMYRRMLHTRTPDGTWDWFIRNEIEEIEAELAEIKKHPHWHADVA